MVKKNDSVRAAQRRAIVRQMKIDAGCVDCGYNSDHRALEYDHLPGTEKRSNVMAMMHRSWEKIMAEIAKCEVVCANCHAIRTHKRNARVVER